MRRAALAVITIAAATLLTGCATACPAIGWNNGLTIDASAYGGDVFLQVCVDGAGCSTAPGAEPTPSTDLSVPEQGEPGQFGFGFSAPDAITVRVFDASGVLIAESEESVEWTHSTDVCGGPSTAPPVVLEP